MTTAITAKFTKGTRTLDLMSGRYVLAPDFVPPPVNLQYQLAEGTSANRLGGAQLVGTRAQNRQWSFGVQIRGLSSDADGSQALRALQAFLDFAGDESEPLYFEFRPNSDTPEPLWGNYGTNLKHEVVTGVARVSEQYSRASLRAQGLPNCQVSLQVKPYATGRPQRLASALGGILEDTLGAADGISRGLIVPEATTNKATNPVFGHATWDNGWVTGPQLISEKNTDPRYILFGVASARLTCITSGTRTFCQSINVGNTNTHTLSMYAKRQDGSAVTAADCQLVYNVLLTTTYTAVGDGWYRLTASAAGINAATASGIAVAPAASIYADGFQIEELSYATPLAYGDLLGCAWTGTVHASTSTRAAGRARLAIAADTFSIGAGAVRVVWRAPYANTHGGSNLFLWSCGAATLRAYYQLSDDKFYFTDGTTSISTSAQTFAAGDVLVLHFVWGLAGLVIYKNGASAASSGTYTPPTVPTYMYIGSSDTPNAQGYGPFLDFAIFNQAPSAAQVLADYTNLTPLTTAGSRVGAIPWLWTKDGDDIIDNCDDSTRDNWAVAAGMPGGIDCRTEFFLTKSAGSVLYLGQTILDYSDWLSPLTRGTYVDFSGTADANSSGGQRFEDSGIDLPQSFSTLAQTSNPLTGQVHVLMRLGASASSWSMSAQLGYSGSSSDLFSSTAGKTISGATLGAYYFGAMLLPVYRTRSITPSLVAVTTGSIGAGVTAYMDLALFIVGRMAKIDLSMSTSVYVQGNSAYGLGGLAASHPADMFGDTLELVPNRANILTSVIMEGTTDGSGWTITRTLTFDKILATPRWPLL